jgi:hypothetical protein
MPLQDAQLFIGFGISCLSLPQKRVFPAEPVAWADAQKRGITRNALFLDQDE